MGVDPPLGDDEAEEGHTTEDVALPDRAERLRAAIEKVRAEDAELLDRLR